MRLEKKYRKNWNIGEVKKNIYQKLKLPYKVQISDKGLLEKTMKNVQ